ncbi:hypothetical protein CSKR_201246, partial [Clonorchis sinensis]
QHIHTAYNAIRTTLRSSKSRRTAKFLTNSLLKLCAFALEVSYDPPICSKSIEVNEKRVAESVLKYLDKIPCPPDCHTVALRSLLHAELLALGEQQK